MIKNNNQVEWILIEDKLKKEWNKQDANNKKEEEDNKIISFAEARKKIKEKNQR
jgi:hypothetical protein